MIKAAAISIELSVAAIAAFLVEPPVTVERDLLIWAFRGILGLAFALIYHQLREANKRLTRVEDLDNLERYIRGIVQVLSEGAESGQRSTDPLLTSLKKELEERGNRPK